MVTVKSLFEEIIPKRALKVGNKLKGLDSIILIEATGENPSSWVLKLQNGNLDVKPGIVNKADCTIIADLKIWEELFNGKLSYMKALLFGKLKVEGDKKIALKITTALLG